VVVPKLATSFNPARRMGASSNDHDISLQSHTRIHRACRQMWSAHSHIFCQMQTRTRLSAETIKVLDE